MGGQGQSLPGAMYWESHSMNRLTGQLTVMHTAQWVGQARDHWQLRVLQHCSIEQIFKVDHVNQIHRYTKFIDTKQVKLC